MRRLFGGVVLAIVVLCYLAYDMRLFDGVAWTAMWPFLLLDTSQLIPSGSGAFDDSFYPSPAPLPPQTSLLRGDDGRNNGAAVDAGGGSGSSASEQRAGDDDGERNEQLARWFAVASRAAGDATETDCKGASAAEWSPGCTLGKRGRWFAGRAYCFEKYAGDTCGECKSGLTDFPKCTSAKYGRGDALPACYGVCSSNGKRRDELGPCRDGRSAKCCQDPGRYFVVPSTGKKACECSNCAKNAFGGVRMRDGSPVLASNKERYM